MRNIKIYIIFLTFLALCITFLFDTRIVHTISFLLIISIGIIHGANDIQIIQRVQSDRSSFYKLIAIYTLTVLITGLVFFILPKLALTVFVLISAYHFGEQHFHGLQLSSRLLKYLFFGSYGLVILFSLFYYNALLSSDIIYEIAAVKIEESIFFFLLVVSFIVLLATGFIITRQGRLTYWYIEVGYLFLISLLFYHSSLIWGFAIYFVFWHSLPSLLDQIKFLSGSITRTSIVSYLKSSILYWIMSLIGLTVFVYFFRDEKQLFLSLFFTFLAAITFPHVIVMHKLFDEKK